MTTQEIMQTVSDNFSERYKPFKEFQTAEEYRGYWNLCVRAVEDRELLGHIIFCNDLFHIPPVKTFLLYYREELVKLTGRRDAMLEPFVKKAIGAFWGMVFKFGLGYQAQESVSVSLNQMFMLRTASYFIGPREKLESGGNKA